MAETSNTCARCSGTLQQGIFRAIVAKVGAMEVGEVMVPISGRDLADVQFIIPGDPIPWNPVKAFLQGLHGDKDDVAFPVTAWRCADCGLLEIYARQEPTS